MPKSTYMDAQRNREQARGIEVRQCAATTAKGTRCSLSAYDGDRLCGVHKAHLRAGRQVVAPPSTNGFNMPREGHRELPEYEYRVTTVARKEAAAEPTGFDHEVGPVHITLDEVMAALPQVKQWHDLYREVGRECTRLGYVGPDPHHQFRALLLEAVGQVEDEDMPIVEDEEMTPEEAIINLLRVAYTTYSTTLGHGTSERVGKKWLQVGEIASILPFHASTVRRYTEILWREGRIRSRVDAHVAGRPGRRPRLFAYKPTDAELRALRGA